MVIACREDKDKLKKLIAENESYQNMDSETAEVMGVMVGMKRDFVQQHKEEDGVNMCGALRGLLEDSRNEGLTEGLTAGRAEGLSEGQGKGDTLRLISLVQKKYRKGKALVVIADEAEEAPEVIQPILELVMQYPDESAEDIYQRMHCQSDC